MKVPFDRKITDESPAAFIARIFNTPLTREEREAQNPTPFIEGHCNAITKQGKPCAIPANPGRPWCHVHDPELQCGHMTKWHEPCKIPTGGGPCKYHQHKSARKRGSKRKRIA